MTRCAFAAILAGVLALGACTVPHEPVLVREIGAAALGPGAAPAPTIDVEWWRAFGDPQIDRLVADALADSPSLETALARVRAAHAVLGAAEAARRPLVTAGTTLEGQRFSDTYIIPPPYGGSVRSIGEIRADLSWDLDFWGRQAAAVEQARAAAGAAALDYAAARLALAGSVVQTYIDLARTERRIALTRTELEQRDAAFGLTQLRVRNELDGEREIRIAGALRAQTRQELLHAEARREALIHACALLAGRGADYYATLGPAGLALDASLPLPVSLPTDLLARRPDVRAARARIDAAVAGREVARTAFYPNVNLLGLVGAQAIGIENLFLGDAAMAGVGAAVHLPIFDGGRLRADYAGATAKTDAAIAEYNQTVLSAIRDAADALTRIESLGAALAAQREVLAEIAEVHRLERARFQAGLASRLQPIETKLRLLAAEQANVDLEADRAAARARLVVAVGGGFEPEAAFAANPDRP